MVQALRLNTLSKLTFADSKRFDSLVKDVFTGVPFKDLEYLELEAALREACQEANLIIIESQVGTDFTGKPKICNSVRSTILSDLVTNYMYTNHVCMSVDVWLL